MSPCLSLPCHLVSSRLITSSLSLSSPRCLISLAWLGASPRHLVLAHRITSSPCLSSPHFPVTLLLAALPRLSLPCRLVSAWRIASSLRLSSPRRLSHRLTQISPSAPYHIFRAIFTRNSAVLNPLRAISELSPSHLYLAF